MYIKNQKNNTLYFYDYIYTIVNYLFCYYTLYTSKRNMKVKWFLR